MILSKEIQKLLPQILKDESAQVTFDLSNVSIRIFDKATQISFTTPVYFGGNYIPQSVRSSLNKPPALQGVTLKTMTTIDEENFSIYLHHHSHMQGINEENLLTLLEEFLWIADEWRLYLDEHDKNDLVYIHSRK